MIIPESRKKEIAEKFPLYSQSEKGVEAVVSEIFYFGSWIWYVMELDKDLDTAFGLVEGHECEYGYFSLSELEAIETKSEGQTHKVKRYPFAPRKLATTPITERMKNFLINILTKE